MNNEDFFVFFDVILPKMTIFATEILNIVMKDYPDKMTVEQARVFGEDVLNIVSQIPCGKVTTYGHIAALAGWPSHSRMVGRTLRYSPQAVDLPCWSRQRQLLEAEGVTFKPNGHVDMQRHLWAPDS